MTLQQTMEKLLAAQCFVTYIGQPDPSLPVWYCAINKKRIGWYADGRGKTVQEAIDMAVAMFDERQSGADKKKAYESSHKYGDDLFFGRPITPAPKPAPTPTTVEAPKPVTVKKIVIKKAKP